MYVCMYVYAYIRIHIQYTRRHISHTFMYACTHDIEIYICIDTFIRLHVYTYVGMYIYIPICTFVYIPMWLCIFTFVYMMAGGVGRDQRLHGDLDGRRSRQGRVFGIEAEGLKGTLRAPLKGVQI